MRSVDLLVVQRAKQYRESNWLAFRCYRIRRSFSVRLPLASLPDLEPQVRGFSAAYPWQIWCLWALEERINSLAGAAILAGDQDAAEVCARDLDFLAQWPNYPASEKLDLPFGHAVQLMTHAYSRWHWLPKSTRELLRAGLQGAVDEGLGYVSASVGSLLTCDELLKSLEPHRHLHNIPLIAQAALACAAEVIGHPDRVMLSIRFEELFRARLAMVQSGLTEGISYDGYLYNFAFDWLSMQPDETRDSIIGHLGLLDLERQARGLACPGANWQSAEIGDVEPVDMPFVWSALAKLQNLVFSSERESILQSVPPAFFRADGLLARKMLMDSLHGDVEPDQLEKDSSRLKRLPAVWVTNTAVTLSSGECSSDLSVVVSSCQSPMNHIQADSGTLLIGHAKRWWITDPGYQQYLKTSERTFTLGVDAHNTPVINGFAHLYKRAYLLNSGSVAESDIAYAVFELTACYPDEADADVVIRTIWRVGKRHVVICDTVVCPSSCPISYSWHADQELYWGQEAGAVSLYDSESSETLWVRSGCRALSLADQQRLRGSRGPCTLQVKSSSNVKHHWWCFSFADASPTFIVDDLTAKVDGFELELRRVIVTLSAEVAVSLFISHSNLSGIVGFGDEPLGTVDPNSYFEVTLWLDGCVIAKQFFVGRRFRLPLPLIRMTDEVRLSISKQGGADGRLARLLVDRKLTEPERRDICAVPLRVYIGDSIDRISVTGRCELLPEALSVKVEYAFYLLVDGHKSQVCWYQSESIHTFMLNSAEIGKPIQIRAFVRCVDDPEKKLSSISQSIIVG